MAAVDQNLHWSSSVTRGDRQHKLEEAAGQLEQESVYPQATLSLPAAAC